MKIQNWLCRKDKKNAGFTLAEVLVATTLVLLIAVNSWNIFNITIGFIMEGMGKMVLLSESATILMHMRYHISEAMDLCFNSSTDIQGAIEPFRIDRGAGWYEPDGDRTDATTYIFRYYLNGNNLEFTTTDPSESDETLSDNVSNFQVAFDTHNQVTVLLELSRASGNTQQIVKTRATVVAQCKNNLEHWP